MKTLSQNAVSELKAGHAKPKDVPIIRAKLKQEVF